MTEAELTERLIEKGRKITSHDDNVPQSLLFQPPLEAVISFASDKPHDPHAPVAPFKTPLPLFHYAAPVGRLAAHYSFER